MHSQLFISKENFKANINIARSVLEQNTKLCVSLKGDAYGHGLRELITPAVESGVDYIGICTNEEAEIAAHSIEESSREVAIIRLRPTFYEEAEELMAKRIQIEEMLGSWEQALRLNRLGLKYEEEIAVHINLDSGMGRAGFYFKREEQRKQLLELPELPGIKVRGIMSHFPRAEEQELARTREALTRFKAAVAYLREQNSNYKETLVHAASSALGIRVPDSHLDMVRFGAVIYGSRLSKHVPKIEGIKAVMSWKTRVIKISNLEAGASLGYGSYRTDEALRIATLPLGYGDGYPRALSNKGYVLIQGEKCPIVGSICLNTMTVKVPQKVTLGDEVVLLGCQEDNCIEAEELAAQFDSVHTEVQLAGVFNQRQEE